MLAWGKRLASASLPGPSQPASTAADEPECIICLEPLCGQSTRPSRTLGCGHDFHDDCIRQWLSETSHCPCCRKSCEHPTNDVLGSRVDPPAETPSVLPSAAFDGATARTMIQAARPSRPGPANQSGIESGRVYQGTSLGRQFRAQNQGVLQKMTAAQSIGRLAAIQQRPSPRTTN